MLLLAVGSDRAAARGIERMLRAGGVRVEPCARVGELREKLAAHTFVAVIVTLPPAHIDVTVLVHSVRQAAGGIPIVIRARQPSAKQCAALLDSGADEYVGVSKEPEELLARLRSLARRSVQSANFGPFVVDSTKPRVWMDGACLNLAGREFALLWYLLRHADRVVRRSELLSSVWDLTFDPGSNLIDVYVCRLRERLGTRAHQLSTVRGVGYQLTLTDCRVREQEDSPPKFPERKAARR